MRIGLRQPEDLRKMEQTALRAPRTTGATGWGAQGPGQTFERARSTKVGDGLVPVRTAIRIGTEAEPGFMGLWVPESGMRDFRDAHPRAQPDETIQRVGRLP